MKNKIPKVPEDLIINPIKWKALCYAINRDKNIMMVGPSGEGKTKAAYRAAEAMGKSVFPVNLGEAQDAQTYFIGKTILKDGKTQFIESEFLKAIQTPNTVIILDEFSRAEADASNILMTVLDEFQRCVRVPEIGNKKIHIAKGVSFIATANIGVEYTFTNTMDRASRDRFFHIEMTPLSKSQSFDLISSMYNNPDISEDINKICTLAEDVYLNASSSNPTIYNTISTRRKIQFVDMVNYGFTFEEAIISTILPLFSTEGGNDSERYAVEKLIEKIHGRLGIIYASEEFSSN